MQYHRIFLPWVQAKAIAQPFAYEEYRKERIKKKIEEARANRVKHKVFLHVLTSLYITMTITV